MTPVWLFLLRATVLAGDGQSFTPGSEVQVKCMERS